MKKDYTHLVIISDRSGSMEGASKTEYENGINNFIKEQAEQPGDCTITFCEFDYKIDFVHDFSNIKNVEPYELIPRGLTALYQAIGETFELVGKKLYDMDEESRPSLVNVIISTDGFENASNKIKWPLSKIKDIIKTQRDIFNWNITFIGADIDAEKYSSQFGISKDSAVSFNKEKAERMYKSLSAKVSNVRSMSSAGASRNTIKQCMEYTDDEKTEINK